MGGNNNDSGNGIEIDASDNVFITGDTHKGSVVDFPTTVGAFDETHNAGIGSDDDGFVSKLSNDLSTLLASTFLGGGNADEAFAITLDTSGNAFITGRTTSISFPTTVGAFNTTYSGGGGDAFVSKLNNDLSSLLASTFIGGEGNMFGTVGSDRGHAIALDDSSNVFITGSTQSSSFPTTVGAFDTTYNGGTLLDAGDAFVSKLNSDLTTLLASTYIGGDEHDTANVIGIDQSGNAFIGGDPRSTNYPATVGAFDEDFSSGDGSFISKFNNDLTDLLASTHFEGDVNDFTFDDEGNIVFGGDGGPSVPTTVGAFDETHNGGPDVVVARLTNDLATLVASTFIGGVNSDSATGIVLDESGDIFLTGFTRSPNYPTSVGAFSTELTETVSGTDQDAFVTHITGDLLAVSEVEDGLLCFNTPVTIEGTEGNDFLVGTEGVDVIHGLGGNDTIVGFGENDIMCGGEGDDKIFGGNGNDTAIGGAGNDFISLGNGADTAFGGPGNDLIFGGDDNDDLNGGTGDDGINGQEGDDNLIGGPDTDRLNGGPHDVRGDFCADGETLIDCEATS